jgi:RNA polymerase sigma-70 factor (ECF subfamily)
MAMPLTTTAAGEVPSTVREVCRLTAAMSAGDEVAYRQFHAQYFDRLLRYLFVVARGDEQAARDALQDTLLRVVRHVRPFRSEDEFWSWLTVLARSAATDAVRKRTRYCRALSRYALFWRVEEMGDDAAEASHLDDLLVALTQTLPVIDRTLIEARYFQGASVRELAVRFELTEKAVESRLGRARRYLRSELSKRLSDEKK